MSRRGNTHKRCAACRMFRALCVCSLIPTLNTRTRLLLVVHTDEARKPTNTGLLAARALVHSRTVVVGEREHPVREPVVSPTERAVLLFPAPDATPLDALNVTSEPVTLVVPDGTWRQARKMASRVPGLATLPKVALPAGPESIYRLRHETKDQGLATLEAIARAFAVLEGPSHGPDVASALLKVFRVMVERTLWLRGALHDADVTGGIPETARVCDPRNGA